MRNFTKGTYLTYRRFLPLLVATVLISACGRKQHQISPALESAREAILTEDWDAARTHLRTALGQSPNSITAQMNLAMAQWLAGDLNDAIATFNRVIDRETVPPVAWTLYAQLQLEAGNPHATRELLRALDQQTPATLTLSAMADIQMQAYERARLTLEEALEQDTTYAAAWYHLAILYRDYIPNRVESQMALRTFKEYAKQNPRAAISENAFFGQADGEATPTDTPHEDTANISLQPHGARTTTPATTLTHITNSIADAQTALQQGDTDAALIKLQEIVKQHPDHPDAVWALASFYDKELHRQDRADTLYTTFQQLFPHDPRGAQIPQRVRTTQRQRPTATDAARQTRLFQQGIEHYSKEQWDAAITAFRRVLSIAPQDAGAAFNLGLTYHKTGDLDAAANAFRQALEHEPDMIKSLYMLGLTERDRNNIPEALQLLNRVIRTQPDFAKAHQVLGRIYLREGRPDMTAIHYRRILEIDPDSDEARRAREWLDTQQPTR
ncbi:MAG: tetratricopeptide repeat protein [Kiritimatiellia bacterium]